VSPKDKPTKPVAIYTRVSDQGDRSDESLRSHEIQRRKVASYLDSKSIAASDEVFEDNDRSGGKMSRPAFNRAVEAVREGRLGGIAVYHLSRFGRTTVGVLELIYEFENLLDPPAAVISLDPQIDTSDATGRAMLTVFMAFYTLEREQAVEKAHDAHDLKISEGATTGGKAPVGYDFEVIGYDSNEKPITGWLVPNGDAPTVTTVFGMFDRGELETPGKVADFLNSAGVSTSKGNTWGAQNIVSFLKRKAYVGIRTYKGRPDLVDAHEALVDADVFRRVQRKMEPKTTRSLNRGEGHVLGRGLCRCGLCGGGLTKGIAAGRYPSLRCNGRGSGHASMSYSLAEAWVTGVAFTKTHMAFVVERDGGEVELLRRTLAAAQAELKTVSDLTGVVGLPGSVQAAAVESAQQAVDDAEVDGGPHPAFEGMERFMSLPVAEKRAALASVISEVVIQPGRGKPSDRMVAVFHDGTTTAARDLWNPAPSAGGD
jgi:DNA invertase Pin-like site-specific DNA recombinase